jgi:hypothetical protein
MVGQSGVFVLQNDNSLISMQPAQFATEEDFQRLLSRFPTLLVGDQIPRTCPCCGRGFLLFIRILTPKKALGP